MSARALISMSGASAAVSFYEYFSHDADCHEKQTS
jgi:hypothetical protein